MFGLGMRLPRKSRVNTRTLRARVLMCFVCFGELLCEYLMIGVYTMLYVL